MFKKKYYCIKQHDITDCGAACLATISKQYGYKIPITKIREVAGTDKQGTNAYGVIKLLKILDFLLKELKEIKKLFFGFSFTGNSSCRYGWKFASLCGHSCNR